MLRPPRGAARQRGDRPLDHAHARFAGRRGSRHTWLSAAGDLPAGSRRAAWALTVPGLAARGAVDVRRRARVKRSEDSLTTATCCAGRYREPGLFPFRAIGPGSLGQCDTRTSVIAKAPRSSRRGPTRPRKFALVIGELGDEIPRPARSPGAATATARGSVRYGPLHDDRATTGAHCQGGHSWCDKPCADAVVGGACSRPSSRLNATGRTASRRRGSPAAQAPRRTPFSGNRHQLRCSHGIVLTEPGPPLPP